MQLLILALDLPARNKRLEPAIEIGHAGAGVCDCENNQDDGDDGEGGEGVADGVVGVVAVLVLFLVHADEFEEEVGEGGDVEELAGWEVRDGGVRWSDDSF